MNRTLVVAAATIAIGLAACDAEPNLADYATNEIEAVFKVQNTESGNEGAFEVILLGPSEGLSPNYIKLPEEATLTATWGDESLELEQVTQGVITYGGPFTTTEATEFNIAFTRPDGEDAPLNPLFLAAPFEITGVSGTISTGESLDIDWSGGSGSAQLVITGDCIQQYGATADLSAGSVSVPFESLVPVDAGSPTGCALTTQMEAATEGAADPAWNAESLTVGRVLRRRDGATAYQP